MRALLHSAAQAIRALGYLKDVTVLKKFGDVPDDLSAV